MLSHLKISRLGTSCNMCNIYLSEKFSRGGSACITCVILTLSEYGYAELQVQKYTWVVMHVICVILTWSEKISTVGNACHMCNMVIPNIKLKTSTGGNA